MEAQGCSIPENTLHQGSKSKIPFFENDDGESSSSKRTGTLNVRHFFFLTVVQIVKKNPSGMHCPMDKMVRDCESKFLQDLGHQVLPTKLGSRSVLEGSDLSWKNAPSG